MTTENLTTANAVAHAIKKKQEKLTAERLRELFHYDPETGIFTNRVTRASRARAGQVAGAVNTHGYVHLTIDRIFYSCHRLAVLYMSGQWPDDGLQVDHINGNRQDNRWENLRLVVPSENSYNRAGAQNNSKSRVRGVSKSGVRWRVSHVINGKRMDFGGWETLDDATTASYQIMVHYGILGKRMKAPANLPAGIPVAPPVLPRGVARAKGVSWSSQKGTWIATIKYDGRPVFLGQHETVEDASAAYSLARSRITAGLPPK